MSDKKLGLDSAFATQKEIPIGFDKAGNKKYDIRLTGGISKRLYIATMAMQGILAGRSDQAVFNLMSEDRISRFAYKVADELLKNELE